jgi:hypothetical protein
MTRRVAGQQRPGDRAAVGGDETVQDVWIGEVRALCHEGDIGERG